MAAELKKNNLQKFRDTENRNLPSPACLMTATLAFWFHL